VTKPYFFAIEAAGGKVSHILGTRHVGVELAKFPPVVASALHAAKLAVFEVAPGDEPDRHTPDVALAKQLGPDLWAHYTELVGKQMAAGLQDGRPEVALIGMMIMYENVGATLDLEIEREVKIAKIPAQGLETAAFQDALIEKLFDLRMLRATIKGTKDRHELADESGKDLGQYCAGSDETAGLEDDTRKQLLADGYTEAELASIDDQMVFARNASWIPKLEQLLVSGDVFIAVGADHLIGDRGVVALLRKRGFKVTRVVQ
jgi:uncharacterized protein YbaP (TraB family)